MPIEFNCQSCSRLLRVPDGSGGKSCQCPGCGELLEIPAPRILAVEDAVINEVPDAVANDGKLHIPCPKCKHHLICEPKLLGTKGQCRNCKHIFTISEAPTVSTSTFENAENWVFSCPKCDQLFEGKESMQGRRGKCHACGEVFDIKLRVADQDASPPEPEKRTPVSETTPPAVPIKPTGAFSTGSATPKATSNTAKVSNSAQASRPAKAAKPSSPVINEPIRFNCSGCAGTMEVPGSTAGQITICPYCKIQLTIPAKSTVSGVPSSPTTPTQSTASAPANDIWSDLDPFGSPAPAQQANAPYPAIQPAPTNYAPLNYAPVGYAARNRARSNAGYTVAGMLIIISAALEILYLIYQFVMIVLALSRPLPPVEGIMVYLGIAIAVLVLALILVIVKLFGGIAMVRRCGLASAKTGAVLSCLPCLCCILNVPIGIWACILTFSSDAERHFS